MKVRLKRKNILFLLILIFLLLNIRFFYLIKLPAIFSGETSNVFLPSIGAICIFFIFLSMHNFKFHLGRFSILIMHFFVILFINDVSMLHKYNYTLSEITWSTAPYFILLMYFPIRKYFVIDNGFDIFIKTYEILCIIFSTLLIIQNFMYMNNNIIFLDICRAYIERFQHINNGDSFLVYYVEGFLRLAPIISAYKIIAGEYKIKGNVIHWLTFALTFYAITFIGATRAYILSIVVALGVMFISFRKSRWNFRKIIIVLLAIILCGVVLYMNINSIMTTLHDSRDGSNYARVGAIKYYLEHFIEHPLMGYGYVIPDRNSPFYYQIKGNLGIYNFDDIGLIGILGSMGILGSFWYILVWIKLLKLSINNKYKPLCLGLVFMMLTCMLTLSYLDRPRIVVLMLTMAIIDCTYENSRRINVFSNYNRL